MKKVSVIMPIYNDEKYLKDSIESIINQSFTNWELILIIEYKSNKESKKIAREYQKKDHRIKIIENKLKKGISESLNIGIKNATGDYIARMDADDISIKDRLKVQYEYLEKNLDIDILASNSEYFGDVTGPWFSNHITLDRLKVNLLISNPICHPTVFFRKSSLTKYNLKYNKKYFSEDYELWCDAVIKGCKIKVLDDILLHYRKNNSNVTSNNKVTRKRIKSCIKTLKKYYRKMLNLKLTTRDIMNLQILFEYNKSSEVRDNLVIKVVDFNKKYQNFNEEDLTFVLGYYNIIKNK